MMRRGNRRRNRERNVHNPPRGNIGFFQNLGRNPVDPHLNKKFFMAGLAAGIGTGIGTDNLWTHFLIAALIIETATGRRPHVGDGNRWNARFYTALGFGCGALFTYAAKEYLDTRRSVESPHAPHRVAVKR